jgi:hypothetical protein
MSRCAAAFALDPGSTFRFAALGRERGRVWLDLSAALYRLPRQKDGQFLIRELDHSRFNSQRS